MKTCKHRMHLTPNEVAELLMVNPVTVRQWAARGLLRFRTTPGGHRRFLLSDVEEFARSRGTTALARRAGRPDRVLGVVGDVSLGLSIVYAIRQRDPQVQTEIARDVFDAGVKVESFRPHALVLDLTIPGMDGLELIRRLRARPSLDHVTILVMAEIVGAGSIERILQAGADACLRRPPEPERLLAGLGLAAD